jgi:hypothetical protein
MRQWSGAIGLALGLLVVACGEVEEQPDGTATAMEEGAAVMLDEPVCQPSERMDVVGRTSPYDSTSIEVGDGMAKICYGRPSLKGRTMIGGDAVPFDTLWRTGANEPTTLHVNVPVAIAGIEVEPGSYSLYTIPRAGEEWTLIVNRSTSQWGHESTYTEEVRGQEVGRAEVQVETLDSRVEQLTFLGSEADAGEGGVVLEWQDSRVHIPITPAG